MAPISRTEACDSLSDVAIDGVLRDAEGERDLLRGVLLPHHPQAFSLLRAQRLAGRFLHQEQNNPICPQATTDRRGVRLRKSRASFFGMLRCNREIVSPPMPSSTASSLHEALVKMEEALWLLDECGQTLAAIHLATAIAILKADTSLPPAR